MLAVFLALVLVLMLGTVRIYGAEVKDAKSSGYKLFPRDLIKMTILGEPDMTLERRIDGDGRVSLPLIGNVEIRGMTIPQAEDKIRAIYVEREIYIRPQVNLSISEYYPREVSVLGQVRNPGKISLPIEAETISIVEAISKAGGFTRISKGEAVQVTRHKPDGTDQSTTVDVSGMIEGKGAKTSFLVEPDDVVFVPERIF